METSHPSSYYGEPVGYLSRNVILFQCLNRESQDLLADPFFCASVVHQLYEESLVPSKIVTENQLQQPLEVILASSYSELYDVLGGESFRFDELPVLIPLEIDFSQPFKQRLAQYSKACKSLSEKHPYIHGLFLRQLGEMLRVTVSYERRNNPHFGVTGSSKYEIAQILNFSLQELERYEGDIMYFTQLANIAPAMSFVDYVSQPNQRTYSYWLKETQGDLDVHQVVRVINGMKKINNLGESLQKTLVTLLEQVIESNWTPDLILYVLEGVKGLGTPVHIQIIGMMNKVIAGLKNWKLSSQQLKKGYNVLHEIAGKYPEVKQCMLLLLDGYLGDTRVDKKILALQGDEIANVLRGLMFKSGIERTTILSTLKYSISPFSLDEFHVGKFLAGLSELGWRDMILFLEKRDNTLPEYDKKEADFIPALIYRYANEINDKVKKRYDWKLFSVIEQNYFAFLEDRSSLEAVQTVNENHVLSKIVSQFDYDSLEYNLYFAGYELDALMIIGGVAINIEVDDSSHNRGRRLKDTKRDAYLKKKYNMHTIRRGKNGTAQTVMDIRLLIGT